MKNLLAFIAGAVVGSAVTYMLLRENYEEVESPIEELKKNESTKLEERKNNVETAKALRKKGYSLNQIAEKMGLGNDSSVRSLLNEDILITYDTDKPSIEEYAEQIGKLNYSQFSKKGTDEEATQKETSSEIHLISPDEYGELDDYDQETLYFYEKDETLIDIYDEILQDEVNIAGTDYMNHFGDYDDNSVFVRNDYLKTDYEIVLVHSSFTDPDSDSVDDE